MFDPLKLSKLLILGRILSFFIEMATLEEISKKKKVIQVCHSENYKSVSEQLSYPVTPTGLQKGLSPSIFHL